MSSDRLALRRDSFLNARARFDEALTEWRRDPNDMVRDSLIKRFEFTFELAWKAMQDWPAAFERDIEARGPRQSIEGAASRLLIRDPDRWARLLDVRNVTEHVYDERQVAALGNEIVETAPELFDALAARLAIAP